MRTILLGFIQAGPMLSTAKGCLEMTEHQDFFQTYRPKTKHLSPKQVNYLELALKNREITQTEYEEVLNQNIHIEQFFLLNLNSSLVTFKTGEHRTLYPGRADEIYRKQLLGD